MGSGANDLARGLTDVGSLGLAELPGTAGDIFKNVNPITASAAAGVRTVGGASTAINAPADAATRATQQAAALAAKQDAAAAAAADQLRTAPQKLSPQDNLLAARRRFLAGFASTIKTSPLGLVGPALTAQASLTGGKAKLGQ